MKANFYIKATLVSLFAIVVACSKNDTESALAGYELNEELSADFAGTVFDNSVNAYNNSIPGLSAEENLRFVVGNSFNRSAWVTAPSSTTARDGLGPIFNAASCSSCHRLDGRGQPPQFGEATLSMVYRLSVPGENERGEPLPVPNYGDQLNNRAIAGVESEGDVQIYYQEISGQYPDGTQYSLRKPRYVFENPDLQNVLFSPRVAPKMTGANFFDGISDAVLLANADPNDADGDGVSGKVNYVWDYTKNKRVIGRIGWKASQASVRQQVAHAFLNDIGITSSLFPNENLYGNQQVKYGTLPNGGNPELSDSIFNQVVFYSSALAMPARPNAKEAQVLAGKKLFVASGCVKCHIPKMETGIHPEVKQISKVLIRAYTDLLLHDMGADLADNRPDNGASGSEWRTAPLWGIGFTKTVNNHTFFLHDGRARSIEEAILWHGGEAGFAKGNFLSLDKIKREQVLAFINSL